MKKWGFEQKASNVELLESKYLYSPKLIKKRVSCQELLCMMPYVFENKREWLNIVKMWNDLNQSCNVYVWWPEIDVWRRQANSFLIRNTGSKRVSHFDRHSIYGSLAWITAISEEKKSLINVIIIFLFSRDCGWFSLSPVQLTLWIYQNTLMLYVEIMSKLNWAFHTLRHYLYSTCRDKRKKEQNHTPKNL